MMADFGWRNPDFGAATSFSLNWVRVERELEHIG